MLGILARHITVPVCSHLGQRISDTVRDITTVIFSFIMRSPIEFEKSHHYDQCRDSVESERSSSRHSVDEEAQQSFADDVPLAQPYSAFSLNRRRFILGVVTAAGFFGPLCGAVYLPSLRLFQKIFNASEAAINGTVSIYMVVFAIAVGAPR